MAKRFLALLLTVLMIFSLAGCVDSSQKDTGTTEPDVTTTQAPETEPSDTTTEITTTDATTTEATTEATTTEATTTTTEATTTEATTVTTTEATTVTTTEATTVTTTEATTVTTTAAATVATTAKEEPQAEVDSLFVKVPVTKANNGMVNGGDAKWLDGEGVNVKGISLISFKLPEAIPMDETVVVRIKGNSKDNFRVWLLDAGQTTSSNQVNMQNDMGFSGGDFDLLVELTVQYIDAEIADNLAKQIAFKAPSWDSTLTDLTVTEISVFNGTMKEYRKLGESDKDEDKDVVSAEKTKWVATWGSAMLRAGNDHLPKNNKLAGSTVRQQIRTTVGGEVLKLHISNEYGEKDLVIDALYLAELDSPTRSNIDTDTTVQLTYKGATKIIVPKGQSIYTDEIDFEFDAGTDLAITMELGSTVPNTVTCHTASRCSTWIAAGDHGKDKALSGAETTTSWYFIRLATTLATEDTKVIVCFGDSLTDGASVTTNAFARWPDELSRQLQDSKYDNYAVINMGIGATLLRGEMGRVSRDILEIPGVDTLLVLYGINDIGKTDRNMSKEMIDLYKTLASQCHAKDINVYGLTMTPCKGSGYYTAKMEETRLDINQWMMSDNSSFDGYIDTAAAVADADDPAKMQKNMVSVWNDWLHFNDYGYKFVGKTVYDKLASSYLD